MPVLDNLSIALLTDALARVKRIAFAIATISSNDTDRRVRSLDAQTNKSPKVCAPVIIRG